LAPDAGRAYCVPCEPGRFAALSGATACELCPTDSFSALAGAAACEVCPPLRFTTGRGRIACEACEAGTCFWRDANGAGTCVDCPSFGVTCDQGQIDGQPFYVYGLQRRPRPRSIRCTPDPRRLG
jgi:hypothetical protein